MGEIVTSGFDVGENVHRFRTVRVSGVGGVGWRKSSSWAGVRELSG